MLVDNYLIQAVILAAGKGTRMQSKKPKLLCTIGRKPLLQHTIELVKSVLPTSPLVVIPPHPQAISDLCRKLTAATAVDDQQIGNGHSLQVALNFLHPGIDTVLVLNGDDSFLYSPADIQTLISDHQRTGYPATFLIVNSPAVRPDLRKVAVNSGRQTFSGFLPPTSVGHPLSCGSYVFNRRWLEKMLPRITPHPVNGEYQITSLLELGLSQNDPIGVSYLVNPSHWQGVNTRADLSLARKQWKNRKP